MEEQPVISVIIPTFGRPALARSAVLSVLGQQTPAAFELLVVDDGGTPTAAEGLNDIQDPRLRLLRIDNGGPARARNTGMREARGRIIAFMDDDCTAEPGWLAAGFARFADGVVMVQGPVAPPRPASPLEWHFMNTGAHRHDLTCNLFVRRADALAVDGFDERFKMPAGEDFDFCARVEKRGSVVVAADARVTHALLAIPWSKRRFRPRHWVSAFQLAALHPEVLNMVMVVPLLGRPLRPLLNRIPQLQVAASVISMQFVNILRHARQTRPRVLVEEVAASVLNTAEGIGMVPQYLRVYREMRALALREKAGGSGAVAGGQDPLR